MNRTKHKMRMRFDPEYARAYKHFIFRRDLIIAEIKRDFKNYIVPSGISLYVVLFLVIIPVMLEFIIIIWISTFVTRIISGFWFLFPNFYQLLKEYKRIMSLWMRYNIGV